MKLVRVTIKGGDQFYGPFSDPITASDWAGSNAKTKLTGQPWAVEDLIDPSPGGALSQQSTYRALVNAAEHSGAFVPDEIKDELEQIADVLDEEARVSDSELSADDIRELGVRLAAGRISALPGDTAGPVTNPGVGHAEGANSDRET